MDYIIKLSHDELSIILEALNEYNNKENKKEINTLFDRLADEYNK